MVIERTKNTIKGTVSGLINKAITIFGSFVVQTVVVKVMGLQYAGLNSLFTSILSVLSLAELGIGAAIVFAMYKPIAEDNVNKINALLYYFKKFYFGVSFVVLFAGIFLIPFIPLFIASDYPDTINLTTLYLIYLFNTIISYLPPAYYSSIPSAHQRRDIVTNCVSIVRIVQYFSQIALLLIFKNYYFFVLVLALSSFFINASVAVVTIKKYPQFKPFGDITKEEKKDIRSRILSLFGHELGGKIIISSDSVVVSAILGVTILGIFSNYHYIFSSLASVLDIVRAALVAGIGNKLIKDSIDTNHSFFNTATFIWIGIVTWFSACMLCLYQDFITLWVGRDMLLDFPIVLLIVIYFYCWQFRTIGLTFKDASGLWRSDWFKPYIGIAINVVFNIILTILIRNVSGVLIPTIFIMLFIYFPIETFVIYNHIFHKKPGMFFMKILLLMCVSTVCVFVSFLVCSNIKIDISPFSIIAKGLLSLVVTISIYVLLTFWTNDFKRTIAFGKAVLASRKK